MDQYSRLKSMCTGIANRAGHQQAAEDFTQWFYLHKLQGSTQDANYSWIDFLRHTFGDNRYAKIHFVPLWEAVDSNTPESLLISHQEKPSVKFKPMMNKRSSLIWLMVFELGYTKDETAKAIGISAGRVSQIMHSIIRAAQRVAKISKNKEAE